MNLYRLQKLSSRVRSPRLKLLGLWALHVTGRRYVGVYLDPVLSCNLRCRMCYFSDPERRKGLHGRFTQEGLTRIADALFHRALKLQIGCGAEPTLYGELPWLIAQGKQRGVPYVCVTTNGQLLTAARLQELVDAGLDELTISLHGTTRETYEHLMQGASYDKFLRLLRAIRRVREGGAKLNVRVNYTLNSDNVEELSQFDAVFEGVPIDVLQLRPVQKIGETDYHDFSMQRIAACYDSVLLPLVARCKERGTLCLIPSRENLAVLAGDASRAGDAAKSNLQREAEELAYINVTPGAIWQADFDLQTDTFETYSQRTHRARHMLALVLGRARAKAPAEGRTKKLNYVIR